MKSAGALRKYLTQLDKCSACGLCLPACPGFAQTRIETDGPRGRVALARALLQGNIAPEAARDAFAGCALCGRCDRACPEELPLTDIFFTVRRMLPLPSLYYQLFRVITRNPAVLDFLQPPLSILAKLIPAARTSSAGPQLPLRPFAQIPQDSMPQSSENCVLLFAGCMTRRLYPEVADACVAELQKRGLTVLAPSGLVCCGRPLATLGYDLVSAIRRNLAILLRHDFQWLVTPCPGCLDTMQRLWPHADGLSAGERKAARELAAKSLDINEFLAHIGSPVQRPAQIKAKVWWHRPCLMGDAAAAGVVRLLEARGAEILADEKPDCCGAPLKCMAQRKNSETKKRKSPIPSNAIARLVKTGGVEPAHALAIGIHQKAMSAGAEYIVTGCPGCMLALSSQHTAGMPPIPVLHTLETKSRTGKARPDS